MVGVISCGGGSKSPTDDVAKGRSADASQERPRETARIAARAMARGDADAFCDRVTKSAVQGISRELASGDGPRKTVSVTCPQFLRLLPDKAGRDTLAEYGNIGVRSTSGIDSPFPMVTLSNGTTLLLVRAGSSGRWLVHEWLAAQRERAKRSSEEPTPATPPTVPVYDPGPDLADRVALAVEDSGGTSPEVRCPHGHRCEATYRYDFLGLGLDTELVMAQNEVWKAIFNNSDVRSGLITISGPTNTVGGKQRVEPLLRVACSRAAANQIDWDYVDREGMETLCNWRELVSFE